jgi:hypothetical protein
MISIKTRPEVIAVVGYIGSSCYVYKIEGEIRTYELHISL